MYKKNKLQLTLEENLLYQDLPDDLLSRLNRLINWEPFEKIIAKLHPSKEEGKRVMESRQD